MLHESHPSEISLKSNNPVLSFASLGGGSSSPSSPSPNTDVLVARRPSGVPSPNTEVSARRPSAIAVENFVLRSILIDRVVGWASLVSVFFAAIMSSTVNSIIALVPKFRGRLVCHIFYALASYLAVKLMVYSAHSEGLDTPRSHRLYSSQSEISSFSSSNGAGRVTSINRKTNPNVPNSNRTAPTDLFNATNAGGQSSMQWLGSSLAYSIVVSVENSAFAWKNLFVFVIFDTLYEKSGNVPGYAFLEFILMFVSVVGFVILVQYLYFSHFKVSDVSLFRAMLRVDVDIFALPLATCIFIIAAAGCQVEQGDIYLFYNAFDFPIERNPGNNPAYILLFTFVLAVVVFVYRLILANVFKSEQEYATTDYVYIGHLMRTGYGAEFRSSALNSIRGNTNKDDPKVANSTNNDEEKQRSIYDESPLSLKVSVASAGGSKSRPVSRDLSSYLPKTESNDRSSSSSFTLTMKDSDLFEWSGDILEDPSRHLKIATLVNVSANLFKSTFCGYIIAISIISTIVNGISLMKTHPDRWLQVLVLFCVFIFFLIVYYLVKTYTDIYREPIGIPSASSISSNASKIPNDSDVPTVQTNITSLVTNLEISPFPFSINVFKSSMRLFLGIFLQQSLFYFYYVIVDFKDHDEYDKRVFVLTFEVITCFLTFVIGLFLFNRIYSELRIKK